MATLFYIALFFIVAAWLLEAASDLLTVRALTDRIPSEFAESINQEKYAVSQEYTKAQTRVSLITGALSTFILIFCLITGVFNWIDEIAATLSDNQIIQGLIFFGIFAGASQLISLPVSIYKTFVLEERFGFNRTTPKTFIADRIKGVLLSLTLGAPLLAGILWFFINFESTAWIWAWGTTIAFSLGVQYIAPTFILPLFNTFTPLEEGGLRSAIETYVAKAGFALDGLFMMDGSKRSGKGNAFFTGFGKKKRIALFDTLIAKMKTDEIVAVVAHEVGHCKLRHIHRMLVAGICKTGITFYLLSIALHHAPLFEAFGMERVTVHVGMLLFSFLYTPLSLVLGLWSNARSRAYEFEADAFAAQTTNNAAALATALQNLAVENLSNLSPHPLAVALHYSHPPVTQRIQALQAMAEKEPN